MRPLNTRLWTALITPFTADGTEVDFATFEKLLVRQAEAGNGVLILGSTGEALSLTDEEKYEIVDYTLERELNVPVMVGTPNFNLTHSLKWLEFCRSKGVDAYLAATPAYSKPGPQGQILWFKEIFDAVDAPVMLYNVPSRTGVHLSSDVFAALKDHRNFWSVKESSGGLEAYIDYAAAAPNTALYCGDDNMFMAAVRLGARGLVSVAANVWPEACQAYVDVCCDGFNSTIDWWEASKALFSTSSPVPLKALMQHKGLIPSATVRLPLCTRDLGSLDKLIRADHLVYDWQRQNIANGERRPA